MNRRHPQLYLTQCPVCSYGLLKPILTRYGVVILSCDEEGEIWFHPADVTIDAFYRPPAPSRQNDEGSLLAAPTREVTRDELPASWRAFDWREY